MLKNNFDQFEKAFNLAIDKKQEDQNKLAKSAIIGANNHIMTNTQIDTGYFRANNFITVNTPTSKTLEGDEPLVDTPNAYVSTGNEIQDQHNLMIQNLDIRKVKFVYIQNNLPYALRLELGYGKVQNAKGAYAVAGRKAQNIIKGG